jgi:type II secretory pathway component PulJ
MVPKLGQLSDEDGFTLSEVLVAMTLTITVLFALYGIFDASIRVFSYGNDKIEAIENARIGLERMEREVRAAYPVNGPAVTPRYRFFNADGATRISPAPQAPTAKQITFGNELNNSMQPAGNGRIDCNPSGAAPNASGYTPCEYITYKLSQSGTARTLLRNNDLDGSTAGSGGEAVAEYVAGADGLALTYIGDSGELCGAGTTNLTCTGVDQENINRVRITLKIKVPGVQDGTQTLTTEVALRNQR